MEVKSLFHDLLELGVNEAASDWHIREDAPVTIRIHGDLRAVDFVTNKQFLDQATQQICTPKDLKKYEETGDADFALQEIGVGRFRVNMHMQRGKRAFTFRHVKGKPPSVESLGLPPVLNRIAENKNGIIFVTGTTGSGKSTTMAGMLNHMNNNMNRHIITIEDPIEYTFEDVNSIFEQREVGLDAITFDSALIHALRQDPDVIVVGEMRNRDTFETALTAAETGHLVMTTLHTSNAPQSISRLLDFYPKDERDSVRKSLSNSLRAIICQRLAPKATGVGVVPVNEILVNTPIVEKLIFENQIGKLDQAIEGGEEDGMMSFNSCLLNHVNNGNITEEIALTISDHPQALEMNLRGIFLNNSGGGIIQ